MRIDVVSDFVCPWCFIGTRRLNQALDAGAGAGADVDVVYHPFLLDPSIPEGGIDLRQRLAQRYGRSPERMFDVVESEAKKTGIPLDFKKVTRWSQTLPAHALTRFVHEKHGAGAQHALVEALFRAYFLDGRDIGAEAVLCDVAAAAVKLDAAVVAAALADAHNKRATLEEIRDAQAQGIHGVPFFVIDERFAIEGAQPVEVFRDALAEAAGR